MSDAAPLTRPGAAADPLAAARARLREALQALREEEERHHAVQAGRDRARREGVELWLKVQEAEAELKEATADEPVREVYDYVNQTHSASPARAAELKLDTAQQQLDRITGIERGLDAELEGLERRIARRHATIRECLGEVVCTSPQYRALFNDLANAWARLRGVRRAFDRITVALGGHMPHADLIKWQDSESLNVEAINIPIDSEPGASWATALEALLTDPNAELPGSG